MGYSRLELNGKLAVVIGGTSGIGQAIARGLAEGGADVVPTARRLDLVKKAADQIESSSTAPALTSVPPRWTFPRPIGTAFWTPI